MNKIQRCSINSSIETPAWFNMLLRVDFLTGLFKGTVTVESPLCINTWLPLCRTIINPILFNDLMIFLPDAEGSLGTGYFHLKNFCIRTGLFLHDFKNQLNCLFNVFQSFFFGISFAKKRITL